MDLPLADKYCLDVIDDNKNMLVPWYIMAAYAYYVDDDPIVTDSVFDLMSKKLIKEWDNVEHEHKKLLNIDTLEAGTYLGEYPSRVKCAVSSIRADIKKS